MKKTNLKNLIAITALAFLAGGIGKTYAIPDNGWILTGSSSATGGYTITGSGTNLGPLNSSSLPTFLSSNGGDTITLNAGGVASSAGSNYTIDIEAPNDTLNNHGTINYTTDTAAAILLDSTGDTVNNYGAITSSYGGVYIQGTSDVLNNYGTISAEYSVYFDSDNGTLNNFGTVNSTATYGIEVYGTGNTINNSGTISSTADYPIYVDADNTVINNHGTITSSYDPIWAEYGTQLNINNWGLITAQGGDYAVYNDTADFTLNNYSGATITSGYDTIYSDGINTTINNWGSITTPTGNYALDIEASNTLINNYKGATISAAYDPIYVSGNNVAINNWGTVTSTGEYGIYSEASNFTMNNWGAVTSLSFQALYNDGDNFVLNNWGTLASGGDGVDSYGSNGVLKNWGMISAGGTGIYIDGDNNTLDLNGHSSVIGKISLTGAGNVVNLDFTGLSPKQIATLDAQLVPQGVNSGTSTSSVIFTLRGVNYNIDPAVVNFQPSSYQLLAKTPNQAAVGAGLDSLTVNPAPGTPLFNLLNAIDNSGNIPAALDTISPIKYAIYGDLAIQNTTSIVQNVDSRLNNLRDGSESIDTTGMGGDTVGLLASGDGKSDPKDSKQVVQSAPEQKRWGFFATGNGIFLRNQGTKSNSAGTLAGVDGKIGEHAVAGAFFSYNNSAVELGQDGSHATVESYSGGLYGAYHNEGFFANSLAAYTRNDYTSSRNSVLPGFATTNAGSTHGNQESVNLDGGYDFNLTNRLTVGPIGGLQYVHLDVNGFNETGGNAGLALGSQNVNSLQSRLGGRIDYHIATQKNATAAVELYAAWQHEYLDGSRGITASFEGAGGTPFSVQTGSPQRDAAVVGATVNFTFHNRLTLFGDYELQMWQASNFEQSINGGVRIAW